MDQLRDRVAEMETLVATGAKPGEGLFESDTRFRELADGITDVFIALDSDLRYIYWNKAAEEVTGILSKDAIGKSTSQLLQGLRGVEEVRDTYHDVLTTKQLRSVVIEFPVGGVNHWFEVNVYPFGDGLSVIARDITERERAEEALEKSERELGLRNRISEIFLTVPDDQMYAEVLEVVLVTLESQYGTFGYFAENGAFVIPAMTRNIYWKKCNVPEKNNIFERGTFGGIWDRAIKERRTLYSNEGPFSTPEGHVPIQNTMATPIVYRKKVISAFHLANKPGGYDENDRTLLEMIAHHVAPVLHARLERDKQERDRQQAEEALRESEQKYRLVSENIPVVIYSALPDEHSPNLFVSGQIEGLTGYTGDEFLDDPEPHTRMIHPDDRDHVRGKIAEHREKRIPLHVEYRITAKDGTVKWIRDVATPLFGEDGELIQINGFMEDITEQKRAEERQDRLRANLAALWGLAQMVDTDLKSLCDFVLEEIVERTESRYGFYGFMNDDESVFTLHAQSSGAMKDCAVQDRSIEFPIEKAGLWGNAVRNRKPLIINDYEKDHPGKKGIPAGHISLKRLMVVPVFSDGRIVAVGAVANKETEYLDSDVDQIRGFMANSQLILDRKQAEETLRETMEHLSGLYNSSMHPIGYASPEGFLQDVNEAFLKMTGYSREELVTGKRYQDITPDEYREYESKKIEEILRTGNPQEYEKEYIRKDGSRAPVRLSVFLVKGSDGTVISLAAIITDLTKRKRAEEELRESEQHYRELVEGTENLVTQVDAEGRFAFVNHMAETVFGLSPEECVGLSAFDFVHPDDKERSRNAFERWIQERPQSITIENRQVSRSGQVRHLLWTSNLRFDADGNLLVINGIARDITDRKQAEEMLREAHEVLETRIAEATKMGFTRCLVPESNLKRMSDIDGIDLVGIRTVADAVEILF